MIDDVSEKVREGGMLEDCLILEFGPDDSN